MKYFWIIFLISGCSVNKDVHDMNDKLGVMAAKLEENTTEIKKERGELPSEDSRFGGGQSPLTDIPQVDLSQKSEEELTEIATKTEKIAELPPEQQIKIAPTSVEVVPPPADLPPKKQALIYRIAAYVKQIFKGRKHEAPAPNS